jgi:hypothetical protein
MLGMGKESRQRRLKRERERQRQRTPGGGGTGPSGPAAAFAAGPGRGPSQEEQVVTALAAALDAVCKGEQDAYGQHLDRLAVEWTPGWTQAVSLGLVENLRARVTAAWQRGWQPAELARHIGREATPAHAAMLSDMIVAEMRAYPAARVHPRWAAQVTALEAAAPGKGTWWGSDDNYLAAWYALGREPEFIAVVALAVETLHTFLHLPPVERLLPLPGTARVTPPPARAAGAEPADERMLSRIRALLAKAEATEFAEEAEALSARAQQLMAKYSIDHALLAAESGQEEAAGARRIAVDNPYEAAKTTLLQTVATANRSRVVWSKELGLVTVIGFPADLDAVELLFTSLLVQANTAMLRAGGKKDEYGRSRTRAFRQSFLVSYAIRIGERLAEATGEAEREALAEQEAGPRSGNALVPFLAAREQAVDDAVDEIFGGGLKTSRAVRVNDAEGWASGRAAADLASLSSRAPLR